MIDRRNESSSLLPQSLEGVGFELAEMLARSTHDGRACGEERPRRATQRLLRRMGAVHDSLAERLVAGIAAQDEDAIAACFAADAAFRALIPSGLRERTGAAPTASLIAGWFRDSTELDLVDHHADEVGDRMQITYRFVGVEEGQPYIVEQHLSCIVSSEKIQRADLLCSGFRPRQPR